MALGEECDYDNMGRKTSAILDVCCGFNSETRVIE